MMIIMVMKIIIVIIIIIIIIFMSFTSVNFGTNLDCVNCNQFSHLSFDPVISIISASLAAYNSLIPAVFFFVKKILLHFLL